MQDPHRIEARQSDRADAARQSGHLHRRRTGSGLAALLLRESGNADVQPGRPGYVEAAAM